MPAPYRHDRDALESRLTSVEDELRELQRRKAELAAATASEENLEREAEELRRRLLRDRRALPLLDSVRVASPCSAGWENMSGDERVRFCAQCDKNVYDLSAMTRAEATAFVEEHEGKEACIRLHRRADGTLITSDCPVGAKRKRNRRRLAGIMFGAGAVGGGALWLSTPTMGDMGPVGQMETSMGVTAVMPMPEMGEKVMEGKMSFDGPTAATPAPSAMPTTHDGPPAAPQGRSPRPATLPRPSPMR